MVCILPFKLPLTQGMNQEVHDTRTRTLDLFGSVSECQQRSDRFCNESSSDYQQLVSGRALDPASQRRLREVRAHLQFVHRAVNDLHGGLDAQWDNYQATKNKTK